MRQSRTGRTIAGASASQKVESIGPITGSYDELVRRNLAARPQFRETLRELAREAIRDGDAETGRFVLARYLDEAAPIDPKEAE